MADPYRTRSSRVLTINVFRNGDDVSPPIKVTLKRFDLWNITRAKDAIGEKVRPVGGFVHSIRTIQGKPITQVADLQRNVYYVVLGLYEKYQALAYEPESRREAFIPISTYQRRPSHRGSRRPRYIVRLKKRTGSTAQLHPYGPPQAPRHSPPYKEPQPLRRSMPPTDGNKVVFRPTKQRPQHSSERTYPGELQADSSIDQELRPRNLQIDSSSDHHMRGLKECVSCIYIPSPDHLTRDQSSNTDLNIQPQRSAVEAARSLINEITTHAHSSERTASSHAKKHEIPSSASVMLNTDISYSPSFEHALHQPIYPAAREPEHATSHVLHPPYTHSAMPVIQPSERFEEKFRPPGNFSTILSEEHAASHHSFQDGDESAIHVIPPSVHNLTTDSQKPTTIVKGHPSSHYMVETETTAAFKVSPAPSTLRAGRSQVVAAKQHSNTKLGPVDGPRAVPSSSKHRVAEDDHSATTRSSDAQQDQPNHLVHPAHSINKVPMQPRTEESRQKVPSKTTIQENPSPYYYNENELHTYFPISVKSLIDANITDANSSNDLAENKSDSSFIGGFPTHPSNNSVNEDTVSVHGAKISAQTSRVNHGGESSATLNPTGRSPNRESERSKTVLLGKKSNMKAGGSSHTFDHPDVQSSRLSPSGFHDPVPVIQSEIR